MGSTWKHSEAKGSIWEAYGRHMRGIWEAKWRQKGAKWKNDYWNFRCLAECAEPRCLLVSAYKQTYTAF